MIGGALRRTGPAIAAAYLLMTAVACLGAPLWAAMLGLDPNAVDPARVQEPPSFAHWLGTDDLGRDVALRLLFGGRVSLALAAGSALIAVSAGSAVGLLSGYRGGWLDRLLMRAVEATSSLPRLPLMLLFLAIDPTKISTVFEGASGSAAIVKLALVIVLFGWTGAARLARAEAIRIREADFVRAARLFGATEARILVRHVLPHAASPLIVLGTIEIGEIILWESALSFLGLGVQPPTASWGAMLRNGLNYLYGAPLLLIAPGLVTLLTVAAFHTLGGALRGALDPRRAGGPSRPQMS